MSDNRFPEATALREFAFRVAALNEALLLQGHTGDGHLGGATITDFNRLVTSMTQAYGQLLLEWNDAEGVH